jgi:competence protein ComEC
MSGIACASLFGILDGLDPFYIFVFALALLLLLISFDWENRKKIVILVAVFFFLGSWRYQFSLFKDSAFLPQSEQNEKMDLNGVVITDVVHREAKQSFVFLADKSETGAAFKVMVFADAYPLLDYGDRLSLSCALRLPEKIEDFDYASYLAKDDIFRLCYYPRFEKTGEKQASRFYSFLYAVRHRLGELIDRGLEEPESGVARATILGESKLIDEELRDSFALSGLSHVIAISGTHITIFAGIIYAVLAYFGLPRVRIFYFSLVFIVFFVLLAGAPASAVRAGIMSSFLLYAVHIGRLSSFDRVLYLSAALMLAYKPALLRDDIGFQLSFISVLGLFYLYPLLSSRLERLGIGNAFKWRDVLAISLAAQLASAGLIAFHFKQFSLYSIIANILVVWASPFILIFLLVAIFLGLIIGAYEVLIFFPAKIIIDYMYLVSDLVVSWPYASIALSLSPRSLFLYYFLLAGFVAYGRWQEKRLIIS